MFFDCWLNGTLAHPHPECQRATAPPVDVRACPHSACRNGGFASCALPLAIECCCANQNSFGRTHRCPPSHPPLPRPRAYDVVIVGAGFAGLYMLHRLRGLGDDGRGSTSRAAMSAAPGTGTAIPARAATSRACSIPTPSTRNCSRTGTGRSATPRSPRSWPTPTRRRSLRPEAGHPVRHHDRRAPDSTSADSGWTVTTEAGETMTASFW